MSCSWFVPYVVVLLSYASISSSFSFHSNDLQKCYPARIDASTITMLLNSDDSSSSSSRDVFRVIAPDNIASLFGSASSAARNSKPSSVNKQPANTSAVSDSQFDTAIDDDEEEERIPFEIGNDFDVEISSSEGGVVMDAAELIDLMSVSVSVDPADEEVVVSGDPDGWTAGYGDLTGSLDTVSAVSSPSPFLPSFSLLTE